MADQAVASTPTTSTAATSPASEGADDEAQRGVDDDPFVRRRKWWILSILLSLIFATLLTLLWATTDEGIKPDHELANPDMYQARLAQIDGASNRYSDAAPKVGTGIYVQTLEFESLSNVSVTGYVWQRFNGDWERLFKLGMRTGDFPLVDLTTALGAPGVACSDSVRDTYEEREAEFRSCIRPGVIFPDMVDSRFGTQPFIVGYTPTDEQRSGDVDTGPNRLPEGESDDESTPDNDDSTPDNDDPDTSTPTLPPPTLPPTTLPPTTLPPTTLPPTSSTLVEASAAPIDTATTVPVPTTVETAPVSTLAPVIPSVDSSSPTSTIAEPTIAAAPGAPTTTPTLDQLDPDAVFAATAPGTTTIVWYFEGPVRQEFTYASYPFDDKVVRLRMWPSDFQSDAILAPDYRGYPCATDDSQPAGDGDGGSGNGIVCTKPADTFGVDERIILDEFSSPNDSFFDVDPIRYNTDLGLDRFDQERYPDMSYNLVLRRTVLDAFVSNLVPFLVAAGLAFAVLMTITGDRDRKKSFSYSTTQVITTLSALFFGVLLAHLRLRNRFDGVVYFETFYFVLYLVLLGVAVVAVAVSAPHTRDLKFFRYGDNFIPQLLYWPTLIATIVVVTAVVL